MTKENVQNIMRSQFIYSYGPGAIIESVNGPRLIPSLQRGLTVNFHNIVHNYEVNNIRLNHVVSDDSTLKKRFFKLPSNSSEQKKENEGLYRTYIFPVWKICYGKHSHNKAVLFKSSESSPNCPDCGKNTDTHVRFISACPSGHMDEVPWDDAVHYDDKNSCHPKFYIWDANGSSLSNITITCPKCGEYKSMEEIYGQYHHCTGRFPEKESPTGRNCHVCYSNRKTGNCENNMAIIQRQSTSLRIANTITLLQIPVKKTIEELFFDEKIQVFLDMCISLALPEESFFKGLNDLNIDENKKIMLKNYVNEVSSYENLIDKFKNFDPDSLKKSLSDIKNEEYEFLSKSSTHDDFYEGDFIKSEKYDFLQIAPIEKIPLITAQTSYQRKPYNPKDKKTKEYEEPSYVSVGDKLETDRWYPVYDSVGEGVFISNTNDIPLKKNNIKEWNTSVTNKTEIEYRNPNFIWWHTLSHALIRTLSYDSGYSSASIRERIYYNPKNNKGGILLYTTSTGEDGGMGGLVSMVNSFDELLDKSFEIIETCSYDPLCISSKIKKGKVNGAACIYCLLLSETSCDYNNKWLDRHVLLGN